MTPQSTPRRATSLKEMLEIAKFSITYEGYDKGLEFQPRSDDIIISPHLKAGTTWTQQIAHSLRTYGSMDFEELNDVVPWIERAFDLGWDLEAEQVAKPRLFKSHLDWESVPKGARYIYPIRHPYDVAVSYFRFLEGWYFEVGSISLEEFTRDRILQSQGYWHHLSSWWEQRNNKDILILCYEEMKADLPSAIRTIANFMNVELDDELFDIVLRQSSRDFMLEHKSKYTDTKLQKFFESRGGAPVASDSVKVTSGTPDDECYQLSEELKAEFDELWREIICERFGLEDYSALRGAIKQLPYHK